MKFSTRIVQFCKWTAHGQLLIMVGTKRKLYKDIWKSERNVVCGMTSHTGKIDMIRGSIIKSAALFALPICVGNILQQLYGTVDTLVGRCSKSLSVALILHKTLSEWE